MLDFLNIDNKIKQKYLNWSNGDTDRFTFKTNSTKNNSLTGATQIKILPNSLQTEDFNKDISYFSLYNESKEFRDAAEINYNQFLNTFPSIQIRQYQQNSKLSIISDMFKNIYEGFNMAAADSKTDLQTIAKKFYENINTVLDTNFLSQMLTTAFDSVSAVIPDYISTKTSSDDMFLLKLPFMFYYRMISSKTTAYYELPYNGNYVLQSDSTNGWINRGLQNYTSKDPNETVAAVINYFTKNLSFNMTPTWEGNSQNTPLSFDVEFQLFNDSQDALINNFKFINTIIPANNWFQYHVYSCPPSVFDIRINGLNRFFMCTAKIDCTKLGVMRAMPFKIVTTLGLNTTTPISIPDVYNVKITFTSLLPNNFNNYLYSIYSNNEDIFQIKGTDSVYNTFMKSINDQISQKLGGANQNPPTDNSSVDEGTSPVPYRQYQPDE